MHCCIINGIKKLMYEGTRNITAIKNGQQLKQKKEAYD